MSGFYFFTCDPMGPTLVPPWFQHVDLGSNMLPQVFKIPLNSYFFFLYRYLPESGSVPYTELVPSSKDTSFGNKIRILVWSRFDSESTVDPDPN